MAAKAARIAAWAYLLLGLAALGLIAVAAAGQPDASLAAVYALMLAMPWSLLSGPLGVDGPAAGLALLTTGIAVNATLLFALARRLGRQNVL